MNFSKQLVVRYQDYMLSHYNHVISDAEAELHLNSLAQLYLIIGGKQGNVLLSKLV